MSLTVPERRTARIVFLGAAGVGKTALIERFLHDRFEAGHARTVEELHALEYEAAEGARAHVRLEILDTSGSYAFPAMRALCMRTGHAFALVYSGAERDSLEEVQRLRDEILELKGRSFTGITVVENKADLNENRNPNLNLNRNWRNRRAEKAEVMRVVENEWGAGFVEASARTGENVDAVFRDLLEQVKLPSGASPALRRRRQTMARDKNNNGNDARKSKAQLKKYSSCLVS